MALADKTCVPCSGGVPPIDPSEAKKLLQELKEWELVRDHHLVKTWTFDDFVQALAFTNKVGALAEEQGHHPDIYLTWGKVRLEIWTHAIDGLTESDFILAAKCDRL